MAKTEVKVKEAEITKTYTIKIASVSHYETLQDLFVVTNSATLVVCVI